jgi:orotidine-5'-phosphate decarboxylase
LDVLTKNNQLYQRDVSIADAKRGDIGNTSSMYAKAFFEDLNFDSVTARIWERFSGAVFAF